MSHKISYLQRKSCLEVPFRPTIPGIYLSNIASLKMSIEGQLIPPERMRICINGEIIPIAQISQQMNIFWPQRETLRLQVDNYVLAHYGPHQIQIDLTYLVSTPLSSSKMKAVTISHRLMCHIEHRFAV